jgi:two-component system OmpR family response regulator
MPKVLLAEDDAELSEMVARYLKFEHYTIEVVDNGDSALEMLNTCDFDLAVLDWNMPGKSGVEVVQSHRQRGGTTPILMLTGMKEIEDKMLGLESGADDYLTKPFHIRELIARLRALLRRSPLTVTPIFTLGNLSLDSESYRVLVNSKDLKLIPKEFGILETLLKKAGKVFSTDELLNKVWVANEVASAESVRTHIKNLRQKLSKAGCNVEVETLHGIGYKVSEKVVDTQ